MAHDDEPRSVLTIEERIREDRNVRDLPLGILIEKYGADAVVEALGVSTIAHILGLDDPLVPSPEDEDA